VGLGQAAAGDAADRAVEDGAVEPRLGAEVVVDEPRGGPDGAADGLDGGPLEALLGEEPLGRIEDGPGGGLGLGWRSSLGGHGEMIERSIRNRKVGRGRTAETAKAVGTVQPPQPTWPSQPTPLSQPPI